MMKRFFGLRGSRLAIATAAIFAVAGGIAYAAIPDAGGVYHACLSKNGSLRIVDPNTDQCRANETAITFNQKGEKGDPGSPGTNGTNGTDGTDGAPGWPGADGKDGTNGTNGVSPTVAQLDPGNPHCLNGGVAITDAAGTTAYACSGQNGTNGQPFSGTFTSQNGQYSISVTDTGVTIAQAGGSHVTLAGDNLTIRTKGTTTLQSDTDISVRGGSNVTVLSGSNFMLKGGGTGTVESSGSLAVKGSSVSINGGVTCLLAARLGDSLMATSADQGAFSTGFITSGSPSVCIGG
jgi:hypothetical protein